MKQPPKNGWFLARFNGLWYQVQPSAAGGYVDDFENRFMGEPEAWTFLPNQNQPTEDEKALNWYRSVAQRRRPQWIPRQILLTAVLEVNVAAGNCFGGYTFARLPTGEYTVERERPSRYLQINWNGERIHLTTDEFCAFEVLSWQENSIKGGGE